MVRITNRRKNTLRRVMLFIGLALVCSIVVNLSGKLSGTILTPSAFFHSTTYVSSKPSRIIDHRPNETAAAEERFIPLLKATTNGSICILAFSAYLDERFKTVQILTDVDKACSNVTSVNALCFIWYRDWSEPYPTTLRFRYFASSHPNLIPRAGAVYGCDIHPNHTRFPYAISVVDNDSDGALSDVTTMHLSSRSSVTTMITFAVCTPPLFGETRPQAIAEFIEIHRLLGADMFYFYNVSTPPSVGKLLASYVDEGIVKIIQFQSVYRNKVFYNNQPIMQLDCMYRNRGKARYVAQMDTDEVLMPRENYASWTYLARTKFKKNSAALIFLNRFFTTDTSLQCLTRHESVLPDGMPNSLKRLSYYDHYFPSSVRSKFIYSPDRVKFVVTHYVVPLDGYAMVVLNATDEGVLHHYRGQLPMSLTSLNVTAVDRRACTFSHLLLKQLSSRLSLT